MTDYVMDTFLINTKNENIKIIPVTDVCELIDMNPSYPKYQALAESLMDRLVYSYNDDNQFDDLISIINYILQKFTLDKNKLVYYRIRFMESHRNQLDELHRLKYKYESDINNVNKAIESRKNKIKFIEKMEVPNCSEAEIIKVQNVEFKKKLENEINSMHDAIKKINQLIVNLKPPSDRAYKIYTINI